MYSDLSKVYFSLYSYFLVVKSSCIIFDVVKFDFCTQFCECRNQRKNQDLKKIAVTTIVLMKVMKSLKRKS